MRVSYAAWSEYREKLHQINAKAEKAMDDFMKANWPADSQAMIDYAYSLTQHYGSAAAELACRMYDKTAKASGVSVPSAEPAELASYEDVQKGVYGTLKNPRETPRMVNRLVKRTAADTTLKNAIRDKAQWAWIPSGETCAFCLTLASRGWQNASKKVLKGNHAEHIHANCDCNFQIRFSEKDTVEGYDPDKYLKMYENAEGNSPEDKINALRREHYKISSDHSMPKTGEPLSILDHKNKNGIIDKRRFYDEHGIMNLDIHTTNHGNQKHHDYGKHGEHAHDYVFDNKGNFISKNTRELTEEERKENKDIL